MGKEVVMTLQVQVRQRKKMKMLKAGLVMWREIFYGHFLLSRVEIPPSMTAKELSFLRLRV